MKKTTHHGQVDFILQGRFNRCKSRNIINHVSRRADKILRIITIEAENAAFGKTQHAFIIENLERIGMEGTCTMRSRVQMTNP